MKHYTSLATAILWGLALSSGVQTTLSFRQVSLQARSPHSQQKSQQATVARTNGSTSLKMAPSVIGAIRGGSLATSAVTSALQSGPFGVLGAAAIAASVVTPLTLYRQAYSFSVGYSLSMVAIGLILQNTFALAEGTLALSLLGALCFYGLRLALHLLLREFTVTSKKETLKSLDKTPRLKRIPFAITIGLLYGFMATPAVYLCRSGSALSGTAASIAKTGVGMAWFGAIVEAWTDAHKYWTKRGKDEAMDFHGPSTWWYGVSRHPNYFGEVVFWIGVLVSGLPAMLSPSLLTIGSAVAALCSALGSFGIVNTMLMATKRLEGRQDEKYGGQLPFEEWKAKTSTLIPTKIAPAIILPVGISVGLIGVLSKAVVSLLV